MILNLMLVFVATLAWAGTTSQNIPVTTYLTDFDPSGIAYYIQSDGQAGPVHGVTGEYDNGDQTVTSILNANTYNHEHPGDAARRLVASL